MNTTTTYKGYTLKVGRRAYGSRLYGCETDYTPFWNAEATRISGAAPAVRCFGYRCRSLATDAIKQCVDESIPIDQGDYEDNPGSFGYPLTNPEP